MDGITIFLICLLVVFGGYSVFLMFRNKKASKENVKMLDELKAGDKVRTHVGIFGTIISISETTVGKVVILETSDGKNKTRLEMDYRVIAGRDDKQLAIYDENNNLILPKLDKDESVKLADVAVKLEDKAVKLEDKAVKIENIAVKLEDTTVKLEESAIKIDDKNSEINEMKKAEEKVVAKQKKAKK